ncbi:KinB-signaling pathway activation protein [Paenibacillus sp. IB182496]|uniref:KinB-signaling pathway activation protein n=1 Tax=Paenibacillus sabuli TaxID=2772509 RepID=A0A927BRQ5_9BACL|nr:KinB-signaling pathway activation protein [Paenibacillus sabuli]MBD2844686.1 KinB-signaling pathway activation protein [Paenibacillus sabuli]
MNLRKWFFLFWTTLAVGAVTTAVSGLIMQITDSEFGFLGIEATGFNALMMALVGTMIGAFSHMGFFAYLTLNYIALSILRKKYLWNTLQAYTTLFVLLGLGYILYENREQVGGWLFYVLPVVLFALSWAVSVIKVKRTNQSALVPTLFLMVVATVIEGWPALSGEESNANAVIFMFIPLFVCNAYQILQLHRILKQPEADSAVTKSVS